jgi:probable rRNA maturation factor
VDAQGRPVRVPGLAVWLSRIAPRQARGEVTIAIVSDARIRALNRTYRRKDATTDVLSFPASAIEPSPRRRSREPASRQPRIAHPGVRTFLGDIAIARGVATRQARREGHDLGTELRILALHGLLHLMGYDHERDRGQMRRLEARLRQNGGLTSGLIERTR